MLDLKARLLSQLFFVNAQAMMAKPPSIGSQERKTVSCSLRFCPDPADTEGAIKEKRGQEAARHRTRQT